MSRYTTEVRYICESLAGLDKSVGYSNVNEVIEKSRNRIFPPFEIFDESYRPVLETKILKHFYTREIGCETFGLWQLRLDAKLSVIMPYYNKLYKAINIDIPVIDNVNMNVEHNIGRNSDATLSDTTQAVNSNTNSSSNSKSNSDTKANSTEEYAERRWGKEGTTTYISMVNEYIEKMKNIDAMLIRELEDLFMQIWDIWE